jgi:hypothetical protein
MAKNEETGECNYVSFLLKKLPRFIERGKIG